MSLLPTVEQEFALLLLVSSLLPTPPTLHPLLPKKQKLWVKFHVKGTFRSGIYDGMVLVGWWGCHKNASQGGEVGAPWRGVSEFGSSMAHVYLPFWGQPDVPEPLDGLWHWNFPRKLSETREQAGAVGAEQPCGHLRERAGSGAGQWPGVSDKPGREASGGVRTSFSPCAGPRWPGMEEAHVPFGYNQRPSSNCF